MYSSSDERCGGFTLVELVLVITIVAALAAFAAPRFFDNQVFDERAYHDELASAIRYAQKIAVGSGCSVRVDIDATGYDLTQQVAAAGHCNPADTSFPLPVRLPDGQTMSGSVPPGVAAGPAVAIVFDALGRTDLAADQVLTVGARSFTVQAESGLVLTP